MTQAIFGLIGVLVGGLATWGTEIWRARRREHDEARVAARLVLAELQTIANVREADEPQFKREKALALQQEAWIAHRATLARALTDDGWRALRSAYAALSIPEGYGADKYITKAYKEAEQTLTAVASAKRQRELKWFGRRTR